MKWLQRLYSRINRLRWPKSLRHMKKCSDSMVLAEGPDFRRLYWNGSSLVDVSPSSSLASSMSSELHIIASGPSVSDLPADHFWAFAESAFCVNGAIQIFAAAPRGPRYFLATDTDFLSERFSLVKLALAKAEFFITTCEGLSTIADKDPEVLKQAKAKLVSVDVVNHGYLRHSLPWSEFRHLHSGNSQLILSDPHQSIGFSLDPQLGVFCGKTVTFRALQLAVQFGAPKISIWGMDLGGARFYNEQGAPQRSNLDKDYELTIEPSFRLCLDPRIKNRAQILNRSKKSRLPADVLAQA